MRERPHSIQVLSHRFGRSHRGRNAAPYSGNGLGLVIVKTIAEAHGGEVQAANVGRDARFTIRLPSFHHKT